MESDNKHKKKKQRNYEEYPFEKRSPLQNLNGIQFHKLRSKNSSNPSSSSSSKTLFDKKLNTFSKSTNDAPKKKTAGAPNVQSRSKENEIPTKPLPKKSKKTQIPSLPQWQSGKKSANCGQRSKLSSVQGNPLTKLKKGSREIGGKAKKSHEIVSGKSPIEPPKISDNSNLNCVENCTPVGKLACGSGIDLTNFDCNKNVGEDSMSKMCNGDSATAVKTPPVEASVSPEFQCGSHSKMLVSKSGATPICYGAGHLLSGVIDKRKCRHRGSLKGVCEIANILYGEGGDGNVISDPRDSSIPLLAEASVHWHLSSCDEESDVGNMLEQCRMTLDNDYVTLDLRSSPSSLSRNVSDLVCDNSSYCGSGSVGYEANKRKSGISILDPHKDSEFHDFLGNSNQKMDEHLIATSPSSSSHCINVSSTEGKSFRSFHIGNYSALSIESSISGNTIQTPNSDSNLERCAGIDQRSLVGSETNLITETLKRVALSTRTGTSTWDSPDLGSHFVDTASPSKFMDLTQLQKNVDSVSSWDFDFTPEGLALSKMRISWRDGLVGGTVETDELDCCRCLSDEDVDTDECPRAQLMSYSQIRKGNDLGTESGLRSFMGSESGANDENYLGVDNGISPKVLDYEPIISARKKNIMFPHICNTCSESICTNGGGLVASGDSDWNSCFSNDL